MPSVSIPGRLALAVVAAVALAPAAFAQSVVATTTPGVDSFGPVPASFDPAAASAATIAALGLPPAPDRATDPDGYAAWLEDVGPGITRVADRGAPQPAAKLPQKTKRSRSTNWGGIVFDSKTKTFGRQSFTRVQAAWTMPRVQPPLGTCEKTPNSELFDMSIWPGIGGFKEREPALIQAGAAARTGCADGKVRTDYWTWYEFFPEVSVPIRTLPLKAGDTLAVYVWASSATRAHAHLVNRTTRRSASFRMDAPDGVRLTAATAEWIVEAPENDGEQATLANFSEAVMFEATATMGSGKTLHAGREPKRPEITVHDMRMTTTGKPRQVIAKAEPIGRAALHFRTVGPARTAAP